MAAEEASFKTEMLSTSLGSILFKEPGIPSTNIKAEGFAPKDPTPRILIELPTPGCPLLLETVPTGIIPARACDNWPTARLLISFAFTCDTDPISCDFFWEPKPTTTTSSTFDSESFKTIFNDPAFEMDTSVA